MGKTSQERRVGLRGIAGVTLLFMAMLLYGFVNVVSASTLTSPSYDPLYTGTIKAESEGATTLDNTALGASMSCKTSFEGEVASHGAASAEVKLSKLTLTECGTVHVTVISPGQLNITSTGEKDGTVTWSGGEITASYTSAGVSCRYATSNTHIGTLTGSSSTNATLDLGSAVIPRTGHSFFCGSSGTWTGSFKVTTPSTLVVDGEGEKTTLTSPSYDPLYTGTLEAESEGHISLDSDVANVTCSGSAFAAQVESHGPSTPAGAKLSSLTLTSCGTNHVTVVKAGSLEIHAAGEGDGTVTWSGAEISINVTSLGITCIYTTNNTHIGTLTGGAPPTLDINAATIPRTGGSFFCGGSGTLTGSYKFTSPETLEVDS